MRCSMKKGSKPKPKIKSPKKPMPPMDLSKAVDKLKAPKKGKLGK